jgi:hypothetical protein
MLTFTVFVQERDQQNLGLHEFQAAPRIGEFISLNDDNSGKAQAYEVKAVVHSPTSGSGRGELYVKHVGTEMELLRKLLKNPDDTAATMKAILGGNR